MGKGAGQRTGAHDRRRRLPAFERREVDARWQEAALDRRSRLRRHGGAADDAAATGAGPAMYTMNEDGTRVTRLNTTVENVGGRGGRGGGGGFGNFNEPQWARDSRSIYFLQGGGIYTLPIGAAPAA